MSLSMAFLMNSVIQSRLEHKQISQPQVIQGLRRQEPACGPGACAHEADAAQQTMYSNAPLTTASQTSAALLGTTAMAIQSAATAPWISSWLPPRLGDTLSGMPLRAGLAETRVCSVRR